MTVMYFYNVDVLLENSNFTAETAPVSTSVFLCYPSQLYCDSLVHGTCCTLMPHLLHCPKVLPQFHKVCKQILNALLLLLLYYKWVFKNPTAQFELYLVKTCFKITVTFYDFIFERKLNKRYQAHFT